PQRLEYKDGDTLATNISIGIPRQGSALSVRAEHPGSRECLMAPVRCNDIDTARNRQRAFAISYGTDRTVHGHECAGTRGIDGFARPPQIQQVAETIGNDAGRRASGTDPLNWHSR